MAIIVNDRVRETTSTTGTGSITLAGAAAGFQTFNAAIGVNNQTYYAIVDAATGAWEVGIGTLTGATTLARTQVLRSSNANALVSFGSGSKDVFVTYPADMSVSQADVGTAPNQIPLNQYLGSLAYEDADNIAGNVGIGGNLTVVGGVTSSNPSVISVNSASTALRITQIGAGNALVVEDSANPDASPFVVDANGNVGVGSSAGFSYGFGPVKLIVEGAGADAFQGINRYAASTAYPGFVFGKSRGAAVGSRASVSSGDGLGEVSWRGDDGTNWVPAAWIRAEVDGTPATNSMPGRLVFSTTAAGASSPTERMRIDSAGRVGIGSSPASAQRFVLSGSQDLTADPQVVLNQQTIQSTATGTTSYYQTFANTQAAAFTIASLNHYRAFQGSLGAGSSITNQYGFNADATIISATNNYGFYSNLPSGTGRWNFYAAGSAANYFAGNVGIGSTSISHTLDVNVGGATFRVRDATAGNDFTVKTIAGPITLAGAVANVSMGFITNDTERVRISNTGLVSLQNSAGLSIARTAVTAPAASDGNVFSGTYTPTLTNVTNVDASTAYECQYMRVGNVVTVSGAFDLDATAANTTTNIGISLPIASNFTNTRQCRGTGAINITTATAIQKGVAFIDADNVNDRATFTCAPEVTTNNTWSFHFTYRII